METTTTSTDLVTSPERQVGWTTVWAQEQVICGHLSLGGGDVTLFTTPV